MTKDVLSFIVYMIHACANKWKKEPSDVYCAIKKSGCLDEYLIPFYDVLHTQSTSYIVGDIEEYLKNREVYI